MKIWILPREGFGGIQKKLMVVSLLGNRGTIFTDLNVMEDWVFGKPRKLMRPSLLNLLGWLRLVERVLACKSYQVNTKLMVIG